MASLLQERERTLIETAKADPTEFGTLYEQYVDPIYAYALHSLRDRAAAEDVVAETFQRALEHLDRYEWRGVPFSAWLYRIASNAIATHYRRLPVEPLDAAGHVLDSAVGPEQAALRGERQREVQAALATLPLPQRQVLSLRYGHELSVEAIALILGRSTGATKQLLHRARRAVQRRLAAEGDCGDAGSHVMML